MEREPPPQQHQPEIGPDGVERTTSTAPRVLLAADDRSFADLLTRTMTEGGYRVRLVADGPQLLHALGDGTHYDAVVSDVYMPHLSAIDVLGLTYGEPRPPFILVTAHPAEALHQVAAELGAVGVLPKPFERQALMALLHWAVTHQAGRQDAYLE